MGLRTWARRAFPELARDGYPYSLNQWLTDTFMTFNGQTYPLNSPYQTLSGQKEEIANNFGGYVAGAYQTNGIVFACMLVRMMLFSDIRFAFRDLVNGQPGKLIGGADGRSPGQRDLNLLAEPWPGATTGDLLSHMLADVDLAGNSFVLRQSGPQLRRLRPDWTTMVIAGRSEDSTMWSLDSEVIGYLYQEGGPASNTEPVPLLAENVAHFAPIPDPLAPHRGMSWLTPVLREIMSDSAATSHKRAFFENGATVNLAIEFDPSTTKDVYDFARQSFLEGHQGTANAYKTLFLLGAKANSVGSNMQQMDFKATQGAGETRIAAAAGVHPTIVGLSEGLQGSSLNAGNFGAARRLTADKTLRPLWRNVCGSLAKIITTPPNAELWYDASDVAFLREDEKDLADIQQTQAQAVRSLIDTGFTAESVVDAITSDDLTRLKHTGLFSVQLQAPGSTKMPMGEAPGEKPVGTGTGPVDQPGDQMPMSNMPNGNGKATVP